MLRVTECHVFRNEFARTSIRVLGASDGVVGQRACVRSRQVPSLGILTLAFTNDLTVKQVCVRNGRIEMELSINKVERCYIAKYIFFTSNLVLLIPFIGQNQGSTMRKPFSLNGSYERK